MGDPATFAQSNRFLPVQFKRILDLEESRPRLGKKAEPKTSMQAFKGGGIRREEKVYGGQG